MTLTSIVIAARIERPFDEVHAVLAEPWTWPKWAKGLAEGLQQDGDGWVGHGPGGRIFVRFSEPNSFGVADHWVRTADGQEVYVPLRVVRSGDGAEVQLTLFRQAGMSEADFDRDAELVRQDLQALKRLVEG